MNFHFAPIVPPEAPPLHDSPTQPIAAKEPNRDFSSSTQRDPGTISGDRELDARDHLFAEYGMQKYQVRPAVISTEKALESPFAEGPV